MHNIISSLSLSLHPTTLLKTYTTFYPVQISTAATMVVDVMPWLVNMRRLDRYNIMNTYDRWAEEIQALLAISGLSKAIGEKGGEGDDTARPIIMLSLERDLRDFMAGKINANNAVDLWNGIKKAKKVLEDEEKAAAARSPRANLNNDFASLNVGGSTTGWA